MADTKNYFKLQDKIKFVTVEIISKTVCEKAITAIQSKDIKHGLFQGFKEETDENKESTALIYLDMHDKTSTMEAFNPKKNNVVYIEVGHGQYREEIFFQAKATDQQSAISILHELVTILKKEDMVKVGTSYIQTTKYTDLPQKFTDNKKSNNNSYSRSSSYGDTYNNTIYNRPKTTYLTATEKKAKTKPTLFKRTSIIPTEELLLLMKIKVQEIQKGDYKQPIFKKTKVEETKGANGKDWEEEEDMYKNFSPMCG